MTPEQYHLDNITAIKEKTSAELGVLNKRCEEESAADFKAALKKSGIPAAIIKQLKPRGWGYEINGKFGGISIALSPTDDIERSKLSQSLHDKLKYVRAKRQFLCANTGSGGARKFGAFARTKYGRKITDAEIPKAHKEWIEVSSSCEC